MNNLKEIKDKKKRLRKEILEKRSKLPIAYIEKVDREISEKLMKMDEFVEANKIFVYVSVGKEVDTRYIINQLLSNPNKEVYVPFCIENGLMEARKIRSIDDLSVTDKGLLEPQESSEKLDLAEIDFSIIPCLLASKDGVRLGYGGGYYDRYFQSYMGTSAAILCREEFIIDDLVHDDKDFIFDKVVTEKTIYRK